MPTDSAHPQHLSHRTKGAGRLVLRQARWCKPSAESDSMSRCTPVPATHVIVLVLPVNIAPREAPWRITHVVCHLVCTHRPPMVTRPHRQNRAVGLKVLAQFKICWQNLLVSHRGDTMSRTETLLRTQTAPDLLRPFSASPTPPSACPRDQGIRDPGRIFP